jgi:hypothetical protein
MSRLSCYPFWAITDHIPVMKLVTVSLIVKQSLENRPDKMLVGCFEVQFFFLVFDLHQINFVGTWRGCEGWRTSGWI